MFPAQVQVFEDCDTVTSHVANEFVQLALRTQQEKGYFSAILGGGKTPVSVNEKILNNPLSAQVDGSRLLFFFSDERCVPPEHPASNYRMLCETLFQPLGVPDANIYRMEGELAPSVAAVRYEERLRRVLPGESPSQIDLALLGLGPDGHTASLFPGRPALHERVRFAAPAGKGPEGIERISLTYPVINNASRVWFMVCGAEKKEAVKALLGRDGDPDRCPACGVKPINGQLIYIVEKCAFSSF
mgnify:CR=1 FL=1